MIHQIFVDNFRSKDKQIRIVRIDNYPHPMDIGTAKDFESCEIFNGTTVLTVEQRFVDTKDMGIAMHKKYWFAECHDFSSSNRTISV